MNNLMILKILIIYLLKVNSIWKLGICNKYKTKNTIKWLAIIMAR